MTTLERLGAYLAAGTNLTPSGMASARLHVLDTVGAWVAGMGTPEGRALIAFRRETQDGGASAEPVSAAVTTHCGLARLSEIDDIHIASMTTAGGIVVPAALSLAVSLRKTDPAGLARAIAGGYDAMIRLGLALHGPTILYRGIWPTYFGAAFGVAAVAARLMGLNERQAAHALAFALTLSAPGVGHHNAATGTRWLAVGLAARNGLTAARAARAGFTSDLNLLDGNFLPSVLDIKPQLGELTRGLDQHVLMQDAGFKAWCAARQTMAAAQALKEIVVGGVAPDDIAEIEAGVLPPHQQMVDHGVVAGNRASHLTSLPYQMAIAVLTPGATLDVRQSPAAVPQLVAALMARITVTQNERLLARYPKVWPAHVRVATKFGRTHELEIEFVPGDLRRPLDEAQLKDKFRSFVTPVLSVEGAARMMGLASAALDDEQAPVALLDAIAQACVGCEKGGMES